MKSVDFFVISFLVVVYFEEVKGSHVSRRLKRACPFLSGTSGPGSQLRCIPARTNCVLPEYLENGKWSVFGEDDRNAGEIVHARTILVFECDLGYKLLPEVQFSVCNQQWSVLPICIKTCDSLQSTDVMQVGCSLYNTEISCTNPYNGTRARFSCAPTYDDPSLKERPYLNCIDGEWDGPLPECKKVTDTIWLSSCVAPQLAGSSCILPEYPTHGKWYSGDKKKPGDTVVPYTLITYECDKGYKEYPEKKNVICLNGTFAAPTCLRTCSSIKSSNTIFANCFYKGQPTSCKNPYTSTRVRFSCRYMYKMSYTKQYELTCVQGSWDHPPPTCTPVCGVRLLSPLKLTTKEIRNRVPWMTIIYDLDELICGGTIVAPYAVIGSANCFKFSKERYTVTVIDNRGEKQQESKVVNVFKHKRFQGDHLYYSYDIAVLILEKPFKMSETVLPACLDYTSSLSKLEQNESGYFAGYTTRQDKISTVLQTFEMLYQTKEACPILVDFRKYFVADKFCAIKRDEGEPINHYRFGSSGLVFLGPDGLYYIRGVTSQPPFYAYPPHILPPLFTDIEQNIDFIRKSLKIYENTILEGDNAADPIEDL